MAFARLFSKKRLWKVYARVIWGDWGEISSYSVHGISHSVIWVQSSNLMAGQYMFGGIYLNKKHKEDLSKNVSDYVFLHEYGHTKPSFLLRSLSVTVQLILLPLAMVSTFSLPVTWFVAALQLGLSPLLVLYSLISVLAFVMILIPLIMVRWLDEGYAEVFAASELGVNKYRKARREMREYSNPSLPRLAVHFVLYPPTRVVAKIVAK